MQPQSFKNIQDLILHHTLDYNNNYYTYMPG